jgi:hypothetical protein
LHSTGLTAFSIMLDAKTIDRGNSYRDRGQCPLLVAVRHRNFAATLALAGVLAGTTIVAGSATSLTLALVVAFALMFGGRGAAPVTFTGILAGAAVVARVTATLPLAVVHSLAGVLVTACFCIVRIHEARLCARKYSSHGTEQKFVEISTFHTHDLISLE